MLYILQTALELGLLYAPVALALFLSYRILDIADLTTDGAFTLGAAVSVTVCIAGHPVLAVPAAMAAGAAAGFVTAFLQTKMGVPSILAGIITNTGLYTINLMAMGWTSTASLLRQDTIFRMFQATGIGGAWSEILLGGVLTVGAGPAAGGFPGDPAGPVHPSHGGQSGHGQGLLHQPKLHHHRGAVHRQLPHCLFRRSGRPVPAQRQRKHRHRNGGHRAGLPHHR